MKKPDIELNKSNEQKFWQNTNFTLLVYLIFILLSFQFWQNYQQARQQEIPYSEFLQHLNNKEVAEAVVTDRVITGTLTLMDEKTNQPRRFFTVPLIWNNDLAT